MPFAGRADLPTGGFIAGWQANAEMISGFRRCAARPKVPRCRYARRDLAIRWHSRRRAIANSRALSVKRSAGSDTTTAEQLYEKH